MSLSNNIGCFYALTAGGIWTVSAERDEVHEPRITLSELRPGIIGPRVGTVLHGGTFVGVTSLHIGLYHSVIRDRHDGTVSINLWERTRDILHGETTPPLIACFLDHAEAARANKRADTGDSDEYEEFTKQVLNAIGPNHPVFVVSRAWESSFPPQFYPAIGISRNSVPVCDQALVAGIPWIPTVSSSSRRGPKPSQPSVPPVPVIGQPTVPRAKRRYGRYGLHLEARAAFAAERALALSAAPASTSETVDEMRKRIEAELEASNRQFAERTK